MATTGSAKSFMGFAFIVGIGLLGASKVFDLYSKDAAELVRVEIPAGTTVVFQVDHILDSLSGPVVAPENHRGVLSLVEVNVADQLSAKACSLRVNTQWDRETKRHQSDRVDLSCGDAPPVQLKATWIGRDGNPGDDSRALGDRTLIVLDQSVTLQI